MVNEKELLKIDLEMPPLELELPPLPSDPASSGPRLDAPASPAASAVKPVAPPEKPEKVKPGISGGTAPLALNLLSIFLLIVIAAVMLVFEVPVNVVPELSLTTYVQGLWLAVGCFFVIAMLHDIKTALTVIGVDIVLLLTIFPTLMLLLDTPMNPLYFFVLGLIVLLAFVYLPLNVLTSRHPAPGKK